MTTDVLESRPLYGIGTVARLTGLKQDTLRVWERRYGLGASHKSQTGRRQYTQSDLEHLQLVSALVSSGTRIGEIAKSERKTLQLLLKSQGGSNAKEPQPRPGVVFIGRGLCDWLDEHRGCLSNVNARLSRLSINDIAEETVSDLGHVDCLIVEVSTLANAQLNRLDQLQKIIQAKRILVTYRYCNERWLEEMSGKGIHAMQFPPDPAKLAFEIGQCVADKATSQGETDLGELVETKPRQFSELQLSAARDLQSTLDCECPRHITDLIRALATFEEYSSSCSVENWQDAAVHSCIYAYTGQARWLMEKALSAVLEGRSADFATALEAQQKAEKAAAQAVSAAAQA